jgi:hypothetical protein
MSPKDRVREPNVPSPSLRLLRFRLGINGPFRREQIVQNPSGGMLDRRKRVRDGLLVAIAECYIVVSRIVGLKANAAAHHKGDSFHLGFPNDLRQSEGSALPSNLQAEKISCFRQSGRVNYTYVLTALA